jgi:hypothetical protein
MTNTAGIIYVMCGGHACEISKSFTLIFYSSAQFFYSDLFYLLIVCVDGYCFI